MVFNLSLITFHNYWSPNPKLPLLVRRHGLTGSWIHYHSLHVGKKDTRSAKMSSHIIHFRWGCGATGTGLRQTISLAHILSILGTWSYTKLRKIIPSFWSIRNDQLHKYAINYVSFLLRRHCIATRRFRHFIESTSNSFTKRLDQY